MRKEVLNFESRDGSSKVYAVKWVPEVEPKAILQITHGMAEYIDRYEKFASFLTDQGILVVGDDHLGHGHTVTLNEGKYGYICKKHSDTVMVRDEHRLKKTIEKEYPGIPYFILGHSMGSFILRNYLCRYGSGIKGAIIMGTGMQPKGLLVVSRALAGIIGLCFGEEHESKFIDSLAFGTYNKKISKPETQSAWLTKDVAIQEKYINDPWCGFTFTVNGFKTLFKLIYNLHDKSNLEQMPKNLPILITSGEEDPVGDYGKAVIGVYESYVKDLKMTNVSLKMYPTCRHEILNETDCEIVYKDILEWIEQQI